jgi:hypothetical protein
MAIDEALEFVIEWSTDERFEEMKVHFHGVLKENFLIQ